MSMVGFQWLIIHQALVVQRVDSAIRWINHYPAAGISAIEINCVIQRIVIYSMDSAIHALNN